MNSSVSSINIQCFVESYSDLSTLQESKASTLMSSYSQSINAMDHDSIIEEDIFTNPAKDSRSSVTDVQTLTPASTKNAPSQPTRNTMLARRKRAMFRRAISCESLGVPSPCPGDKMRPQAPHRRGRKPRRALSTPDSGSGSSIRGNRAVSTCPALNASLAPEAAATLKAKRWESSSTDTAPPKRRSSSSGCQSEDLSKLNRWDTDESIDTSGHSKKSTASLGPPQRQKSDHSLGEKRTADVIAKVLSAPNLSQKLPGSNGHSMVSSEGNPCFSPTGRGRWDAIRALGRVRGTRTKKESLGPKSRGSPCLPKRQITPVRRGTRAKKESLSPRSRGCPCIPKRQITPVR